MSEAKSSPVVNFELLTPAQAMSVGIDPAAYQGEPGADGVTFTPSVDDDGNLSWSNDGGKPNPATVNIKGPKGDDGGMIEELSVEETEAVLNA